MSHSSLSPDLSLGLQHHQLATEDLGTPEASWYLSTEADNYPAFDNVNPETLQLLKPDQTGPEAVLASMGSAQEDTGLDHEQPVKLGMLWQILAERDRNASASAKIDMFSGGFQLGTASWDVVIIQAFLLLLLIVISLLWAFCCKKKCIKEDPLSGQVVALARKISNTSSKDLPPSYSKVDLTSIGLSIHDHFNPPPNYDPAMVDTSIPIGEWPLQLRTPRVSVTSSSAGSSFLRSPRISVTSLASAIAAAAGAGGGKTPTAAMTPSASASELIEGSANEAGSSSGGATAKPVYTRRTSIRSLPQIPEALLASSSNRKRSSKSDTGILMFTSAGSKPGSRKVSLIEIVTIGAMGGQNNRSRKVSFVDELTGRSICEENSDLEAILTSRLCEAEFNGEIGEFVEQQPVEKSPKSNSKDESSA